MSSAGQKPWAAMSGAQLNRPETSVKQPSASAMRASCGPTTCPHRFQWCPSPPTPSTECTPSLHSFTAGSTKTGWSLWCAVPLTVARYARTFYHAPGVLTKSPWSGYPAGQTPAMISRESVWRQTTRAYPRMRRLSFVRRNRWARLPQPGWRPYFSARRASVFQSKPGLLVISPSTPMSSRSFASFGSSMV